MLLVFQLENKLSPLISVCIPVYDTEPYLAQCLQSVYTQDFDSFEIVIVSDRSCGRDENGRNAKKIVARAQKAADTFRRERAWQPVPIRFIEHRENRGLIEVRRTLMYEARGFYLTQVDSDDEMEEGALRTLWEAAFRGRDSDLRRNDVACRNDTACWNDGACHAELVSASPQYFDIVHGTSTAGTFGGDGCFVPAAQNRYGKIFYGRLSGRDIFRRWLLEGAFTANTWGKLIKRELWQKAYENIPYTECNMADDVLLFFFLAQYAKTYVGIESRVYRYRINTGMTSARKINSMHKWKLIASAASVFSVISEWLEQRTEGTLLPNEIDCIRQKTRFYLMNNIMQLHEAVVPEMQEEARALLCDYWGSSFVEKAEAAFCRRRDSVLTADSAAAADSAIV